MPDGIAAAGQDGHADQQQQPLAQAAGTAIFPALRLG